MVVKTRCFQCHKEKDDCMEIQTATLTAMMCSDCILEVTDDAKTVTFLYPGGGFIMEVVDNDGLPDS